MPLPSCSDARRSWRVCSDRTTTCRKRPPTSPVKGGLLLYTWGVPSLLLRPPYWAMMANPNTVYPARARDFFLTSHTCYYKILIRFIPRAVRRAGIFFDFLPLLLPNLNTVCSARHEARGKLFDFLPCYYQILIRFAPRARFLPLEGACDLRLTHSSSNTDIACASMIVCTNVSGVRVTNAPSASNI